MLQLNLANSFSGFNTNQTKKINYRMNQNIQSDTFTKQVTNNTSLSTKSSFLKGLRSLSFTGWSPRTEHAKTSIEEMAQIIKNPANQRIAISGHASPDGDSIGSGFALANLIQQSTGKKVDLFIFGDLSSKYDFLNPNKDINVINIYGNKEFKADKLKEKYGQYDLAIAVDVALKRLLPENYWEGIFSNAKTTMRIDHHPCMKTMDKTLGYEVDNNFADYNYSDTTCNSAAQIVMQFVDLLGINPKNMSLETNEAIYTGIISDTDNFKYSQNEQPFLDAALLIRNGVDNETIQKKLNGDVPFCIHKIRQYVYNNIQFTPDKKVAYFVETDELAKLKMQAKDEGYKDDAQAEIANIIESLINIKGVEIAIKVVGTNFSVRSKNADISQLAMKYGGGGHRNASAFCVKKEKSTPAEVVINKIIQEYQRELEND